MGDIVVVILSSHRRSPGSIPHSSQHMTQYFHSFTISLASIFSSAFRHKSLFHHVGCSNVRPWEASQDFHIPPPSIGLSPHFTIKLLISACPRIIPSLEPLK